MEKIGQDGGGEIIDNGFERLAKIHFFKINEFPLFPNVTKAVVWLQ